MAEEELQQIRLRDDFYRDGFNKALVALIILIAAMCLLIATSIYLHVSKPVPVVFPTGNEFRVLPPIPTNQSYLAQADLIQWVSDVLPTTFTYDFVHYPDQLKNISQYFTADGWQKISDQINIYAPYNQIADGKLFVNATAAGAPFIVNQGLLQDVYGWWVQMPLTLSYSSGDVRSLVFQVLVVRVPTLNNINGVAIENVIVTTGAGSGGGANG